MRCLDEAAALSILDRGVEPGALAELSVHLDSCGYCRALVAAIGSVGDHPAPDLAALTSLEPGTRIGKFVVERELGAGASGAVFAVRDPDLDRLVALKLLHFRGDAHSPAHEELLLREARAMAKLSHPNLVPVYEVGRWEGSVFIAMGFVGGGTLRDWLGRGPRARALELLRGAGQGLAAAHDAGLVHRDFKPENILVGDGRARVTDFGLASFPAGASAQLLGERPSLAALASIASPLVSRTGVLVGTPAYMAPEQLRAERADARSDQFAFCVVLHEALFGARPFTGATLDELARAIDQPLPARAGAPRHVWNVLAKGLAADAERRFSSMHALLAELAPRRRRTLAIGAAGAVLLAAGAAFGMTRAREAPCTAIAAPAWTPDASRAVKAAFEATHSPLAPDTFARLAPALDRYAAAWAATQHDACTATRVRHDASDTLLDRRTACLADRGVELAAFVSALEHATPATVERAPAALAALVPPGACASPDPDDDPVQTAEAVALRLRLLTATAGAGLDVAGTTAPELTAIADQAKAQGMPRLRARALLQRGLVRMDARADDLATADFEEVALAAEATRLDHLAARAASAAITSATDGNDLPAAKHWVREAEAAVDRLGAAAPERAELEARRAWYELHAGEVAKAEADARAAGAGGCTGARTSACAHADVLGTVLFAEGAYADALAVYRDNLALIEQDYGPKHPKTERGLERVGATLDKLGKHTDALALFDRAQAILGDADTGAAAQLADNSGTALMAIGKLPEAEARFRRAHAIHEKLQGDHPETAITLVNLANVLDLEGRGDDALAARTSALAIFRAKLPPDHPLIAATLVSIGWHYAATKAPARALEFLTPAAAIQLAKLGPDHPDYAYTLSVLGATQLAADQPAAAAATLQLALASKGTRPEARRDLELNLADAQWRGGDHARARATVVAAQAAQADPEYARWLATHR